MMIINILARTKVALMSKKGLVLTFILSYIFLWISLPLYTPAQDTGSRLESFSRQRLEPFARQGTPDGEKVKVAANDILNAIAAGRDIDVDHAIIEGDLNIGVISNRLRRDESGKPVIRGDIGIRFSEISGSAGFSSVAFEGDLVFSSTTFSKDTEFIGATFNKYADFSSATFNEDADFTDTVFNGNAAFIFATFNGNAKFLSANFSGYAYFRTTTFSKNVDFTDVIMSSAVDFIDATFTVSVTFLRTSMEHPASFEGVRFRENTVIAGLWNNVFRRVLRFLPEKTVTDFLQFDTGSIMDGSSNPYLKRYIDDEQWIMSWRKSIWWREPLFVLWEVTSHCGRSLGLWGLWSALIAVVFAIIYSRFLSDSIAFNVEKLSNTKPDFKGYLYYSVVTLTTLGFGDIVPLTNRARLAVGTEVGLGYVMLGGLISIFANKVASRS